MAPRFTKGILKYRRFFAAFTLIELMVVMAIFMLITLGVLANNSKFNSSVLLGSLAYDIALSIRQAQVYGLSVQSYNNTFVGYGVHFSSNASYFLFADNDGNNKYDLGSDAIITNYSVGQRHSIKRFCGVTSGGTQECSDDPTPITFLDLVFVRPNPDANITSNNPTIYSFAKIVVTSPAGSETRTITVASTGQISVTNP